MDQLMIAVLQRVSSASVSVDQSVVGKIEKGFLILLGVCDQDEESDALFLAEKISGFRVFADENQNMNLSLKDVNGSVLVVSQFTLCGSWRKGRRPSFTHAADPATGEKLYTFFVAALRQHNVPVEKGQFGAMMEVQLVNDGPVTFVLDSKGK